MRTLSVMIIISSSSSSQVSASRSYTQLVFHLHQASQASLDPPFQPRGMYTMHALKRFLNLSKSQLNILGKLPASNNRTVTSPQGRAYAISTNRRIFQHGCYWHSMNTFIMNTSPSNSPPSILQPVHHGPYIRIFVSYTRSPNADRHIP